MMKAFNRNLSLFLCLLLTVLSVGSCSKPAAETTQETIEETSVITTTETTIEETSATTETEYIRESHYTFKTHVHSTVMDEVFETEMNETYDRFIDAVMNGETSFECPDQDTYDWVMGQYSYLLFPVVYEYVSYPSNGVLYENGVGYFEYTIPYEEFEIKLQEFEDIVTGILNTALEDDYSDFEKALALYLYFEDHYVYDYELYYINESGGDSDAISAYNLLINGTDICQGIAAAYSYLCLQAGVDATITRGTREYDGGLHQWSMVTLNGEYYYVDPTYALGNRGCLRYFLMTDEQRYNEDSYNPDNYEFVSNYYSSHCDTVYSCTDSTYADLWEQYLQSWDTENNVLTFYDGSTYEYD